MFCDLWFTIHVLPYDHGSCTMPLVASTCLKRGAKYDSPCAADFA
jgi:hypothetical protein